MHGPSALAAIILASAMLWPAFASMGLCMDASLSMHPDKERLTFEFDEPVAAYEVVRSSETSLRMTFSGVPGDDAVLETTLDLSGASIAANVGKSGDALIIETSNPKFGFLSLTLDNGRRIVVDLFPDPLGARWSPPDSDPLAKSPEKAKPENKAAETTAADNKATEKKMPAARPRTEPKAKPGEAKKAAGTSPEPPRTDTETGQSGRKLDKAEAEAKVAVVRRAVEQAPPPEEKRQAVRWTPSGGARGAFRGVVSPAEPGPAPEARLDEADAARPESEGAGSGAFQFRASVDPPGDARTLREKPVRRFAADELPEPAPERPGLITEAVELAESEPEMEPKPLEQGEKQQQAEEAPALDLEEVLFAAQVAVSNGEYEKALDEIELLLAQPNVPKEMREEAMYTRADILYQLHREDLAGNFDKINGAYESAMNYNLDSERVPSALLRRGILNMRVGNIPEAKAFFKVIRNKYPNDPNVPLTYYYWGDYYFNQGDYQEAADQFQYLVQVYPESKFIREASVSLARSLRKLGYDEQAFQIVDFIEKRWPRFYVEYPPFMKLSGDAAFHVKNWEKAKDEYWTYYNIDPKGDDADIVLARLGDIYVRTDRRNAAREIYEKAAGDFPEKEGGLISKMRLAEEGIYDEPTIEQMFTVFQRPFNLKPEEIYKQIVEDHPESPLAPLAQVKMAMWHLWNKKYLDALSAVMGFNEKFPDSELKERSDEVGLQAYSGVVDQLMAEENYPKIVNLWNDYDFVEEGWEKLSPDTKLAVGLAFWKRGEPDRALKVIAPLIRDEQVPEYSEMALSLALSIYVDEKRWQEVKDLSDIAQEWDITPDYERELSYALALAHENLGELEKSRALWRGLGGNMDLDPAQRAYAVHFLARRALEERKLKLAHQYAEESLSLLLKSGGEDVGKIKDNLRILIDVSETSGRPREALQWSTEYEKYLGPDEEGWGALRYRMAGLYKKAGDLDTWRKILEDLSERRPNSLYGRMADSDLETFSLEQAAGQYAPKPTFQ